MLRIVFFFFFLFKAGSFFFLKPGVGFILSSAGPRRMRPGRPHERRV
jgi:hypothetical protein